MLQSYYMFVCRLLRQPSAGKVAFMAALTSSYETKRKDGQLVLYPLAAGVHTFKGALVCVASATGLLVPGADVAGAVFVGVAYEDGNNVAGYVPPLGGIPGPGAAGNAPATTAAGRGADCARCSRFWRSGTGR